MDHEKNSAEAHAKAVKHYSWNANIAAMILMLFFACTVTFGATTWVRLVCFVLAVPTSMIISLWLLNIYTHRDPERFRDQLMIVQHEFDAGRQLPTAYYTALFEAYKLHNQLARLMDFVIKNALKGESKLCFSRDSEWLNALQEPLKAITGFRYRLELERDLPHGNNPELIKERSIYKVSELKLDPVPSVLGTQVVREEHSRGESVPPQT